VQRFLKLWTKLVLKMRSDFEALYKAIKSSSNIMIVPHKYPDGDALGSSLALYIALKKAKKKVWLISHTPIPTKYQFLAENYTFLPLDLVTSDIDLIIGIDCADRDRLALSDSYFKRAKMVVNIDHHATNDSFGDINIVQEASATGEIMVDIFEEFGYEIDTEVAMCLFTAISSDTGNFMYSNTTKHTFEKVAKLFENDFDFVDITRKLFLDKSLAQTKLAGIAIEGMEFYNNNRVSLIHINKDHLAYAGGKDGDCESLVNQAVDINTVDVAIFIREITKSFYKVSFRSKGEFDVAAVAHRYGGGGHKNAAGCAINGNYETVKNNVVSNVIDMFK
jgi:bifunctional oligoribonuclease and PAP phosphatase NrnA